MTSDDIQLRCFDSFAPVRAAFADRLDGDALPSPFHRLSWLEALHASAFAGETPHILHAVRGDAEAWLFLTARAPDRLEAIANWYSFLFGPHYRAAPDRAGRLALLTALTGAARDMASHLRLHPIVDADDGALMVAALRRSGWRAVARTMGRKRVLTLPPGTSFADYWAARPGPLRSTFRRKVARRPLAIAIHRAVTDAHWADLEAVFRASWKPAGDDFTFLRAFAEREAAAGRLRLGLGTIDGQPAAVELWTVEQGRAYIHKLAFDERFADASPGTQLSHAMFGHAIDADGARHIDFGTGDNDYKAAWMPDTVPVRQIDAFDMRRPAVWPRALATWLSAIAPRRRAVARHASPRNDGRRAALTGRMRR
jgi:hypothetical protein